MLGKLQAFQDIECLAQLHLTVDFLHLIHL